MTPNDGRVRSKNLVGRGGDNKRVTLWTENSVQMKIAVNIEHEKSLAYLTDVNLVSTRNKSLNRS
jgi:hypothetical protein